MSFRVHNSFNARPAPASPQTIRTASQLAVHGERTQLRDMGRFLFSKFMSTSAARTASIALDQHRPGSGLRGG
jgi:hypothetical protein